MRGINTDATGQHLLNTNRGDVFAFGLDYETAGFYDGNIGKQRWLGSRQPSQTRQYTYAYDAASRLAGATYAGASGENYSLSNMSYDPNGNIQTLNRAGIDQLTYSYAEGNKLLSVSDASGNSGGFADGNTSGHDYEYWPDGSLKKDLNRGISQIDYNLLKLPKQISFSTGKVVSYTYTASGQKLRMSTSTGDVRDYTTYTRFLNSHFEQIPTPEGRVVPGDDDPARYEYFHVDHLGNIRAVYYDSLGAIQVGQWTDYDPWGLELSGLSKGANSNRLKFNSKESLAELGSGVLDYGARLYDATIGRWGVVDPLTEKYYSMSPYNYAANNPLRYTDPNGMEIDEASRKEWDKQKQAVANQRDNLQGRIDKLTAKAAEKGWNAEKLAGKIGNLSERVSSLNGSLTNLSALESSKQVYSLNASTGGVGGISLDTKTGNIQISFGNTSNFVHEATHAGQFESGDIAFDTRTGATLGQDIYDEIAGYRAQFAYDPSSVSGLPSTSIANSFEAITPQWTQGLLGGTLYGPGGSANTGISPLNINSTRTDFINAYPNNSAMQSLPPNFVLKKSYPSIHYKQ